MDNSLKNIIKDGLSNLSNIFNSDKTTKEALGIDIGTSSIKVVQLKKKGGRAILETYGVLSLGPYGGLDLGMITNLKPEEISKALIDVMRESNVTTKSAVLAIPSLASLVFTITFPETIDQSQLPKIIPIEARKYVPIPISEVSLDWFIIPGEEQYLGEDNKPKEEKKTEVLVVAIHNETISQYQEIVKKSELVCDSFEMEIFSNIRSTLSHEVAPVMLIDFGASKTKVSIVEAGIVRVFHVVNRGSGDISRNISQSLNISFDEAEKMKRLIGLDKEADSRIENIVRLSTDYIFSDINNVVFNYEKKYNKNISKVILMGGGALTKGLLEKAQENFHIEVALADPFAKTEAPAFLDPVLKSSGPEFTVALGLALRQLL